MTLTKLKLVVLLNTCLLITSCNGQKNKNQINNISKPEQSINSTGLINSSKKKEQISEVVRMMFQDTKGQLWFGTQGGAFKLMDNELIFIEDIKSETGKRVTVKDITEDRNGIIWIGHTDGLSKIDKEQVTNYYESDGLLSNDVWNIETDSKGNIWIGTLDGLCLFDGQEFTNFELPEGKIDTELGISSTKMIHCVMEDRNENIWLCTNAGLFQYADKILTNVSEKVGIETNFVNEIIETKNGEFLISTKVAVYKLIGDDLINITDEIPEVDKGAGSIMEDKDEKIWFVFNQHQLYTYDGEKTIEFEKQKNNKGPVIFQIFEDQKDRLWFVGYGGAYRLENSKFVNITKKGPW